MSTRHYQEVLPEVAQRCGVSRSAVSRQLQQASAEALKVLSERRFDDVDLVVIYLDGKRFGGHQVICAVGVDTEGAKHVLGLTEGATENAIVVKELIEDLVERGVTPDRRRLFVIDGGKALRSAVEAVYGRQNPVQRCRTHKRKNVLGRQIEWLEHTHPKADVRVPVSGPFSVAVSLLGLDTLLSAVATCPGAVRDFLRRLVPGQVGLARSAVAAGLDVAFFESAAAPPLLGPQQFREIELSALQETMAEVASAVGHPVPCIVGGDTAPILDYIVQTGTDFVICPAETDRVRFLERMQRYPNVRARVNLDPRIYTRGRSEEILAEVDRVIDLAGGRCNILLGTGAAPYETPPENILLIRDYVL